MRTSYKGLELIRKWEGYHDTAYLCPARVWTIGYGSTRIDGRPVQSGQKIDQVRAEAALVADVRPIETVLATVGAHDFGQDQFDALVSFAYNLGVGATRKSTLLRKFLAGDAAGAQMEFMLWVNAAGKPLRGLALRRLDEAVLFGPRSRDQILASLSPNSKAAKLIVSS